MKAAGFYLDFYYENIEQNFASKNYFKFIYK